MTATAANGLALMWEMLYIASGMRLPIVLTVVNRARALNIHCDHSDSMGARDAAGSISTPSRARRRTTTRSGHPHRRASRHPDSRYVLPGQVHHSHGVERVGILPDEAVKEFVGQYKPSTPS